jgi:integrase
VDAIIVAALALPRVFGAGSSMLPTLLGLLAATGLRISEALSLRCGSLDEATTRVTVKHSKFERTRMVPLHPTATAALRDYLRTRARLGPTDHSAPFFLDERSGEALGYRAVRRAWLRLTADVGIVPRGGHRFIRIHDLRHTFICRRLMLWQTEGADIDNRPTSATSISATPTGTCRPCPSSWRSLETASRHSHRSSGRRVMTDMIPSFPMLLQRFFVDHLRQQRAVSPCTVAAYRDTFKLLLAFTEKAIGKAPTDLVLADLDATLVLAFLDHLERERKNSVRSRNARLLAIRSFLKYAAHEECDRARGH